MCSFGGAQACILFCVDELAVPQPVVDELEGRGGGGGVCGERSVGIEGIGQVDAVCFGYVVEWIGHAVGVELSYSLVVGLEQEVELGGESAVGAVGGVEAEESVELVVIAAVKAAGSACYGFRGEGFGEDGSIVLVLVDHNCAESYRIDLWPVEINGLELRSKECLVGKEVEGRVACDANNLVLEALWPQDA